MTAMSEDFNKRFKASLGLNTFHDDGQGRIDVVEQEIDDPANILDLPWLKRERARLGPRSGGGVGAGIPLNSPEAKTLLAEAKTQGALSLVSAPPEPGEAPGAGPLSAVAARSTGERQTPDIAEMLAKFVPQDDSSSKYLALAAALGRPTGFGTFGEVAANVADAMLEQKSNQQKLRAQYTPLIMQQIAAQQSREEQNMYRLEAQRQAQQAQVLAAQQAQIGRVDLAAANQAAMNERATADRASREAIAAEARAGREQTQRNSDKAPSGYEWGPAGPDGARTQVVVKGGPADLKQVGAFNADTNALSGATSNFDRLAIAANQVLQHPGLPGITGLSGKLPNMPGGAAADAEALLGTLKSQVAFGVLQDMRNQSKTGGALGAVSEKELAMLQSNLTALDKAQSLEQFQKGLRSVIKYTEDAKNRMREAYNVRHTGAEASAPAIPATPQPGLPTAAAIAAERARRAKLANGG